MPTITRVPLAAALDGLTYADAVHAALWVREQEDHGWHFNDGADAVQQACDHLGIRPAATDGPEPKPEVTP
jgi:glutathione S-transferase